MANRGELEAAKVEAALGTRALVELGLATGVRASLGHSSMRVPGDPEKFVVKGRGYRVDVLSRVRPEDMVVCDLEGNFVDGPPYSSQCTEVMIHSCIYKARPDVVSITHVHPDYCVLITVLGKDLVPMAQEGVRMVLDPIPVFPQTKVVTSKEEGEELALLLGDRSAVLLMGHGAVTVSSQSVGQCVVAMAELEHQARLNYLAMCAAGPNHPSIPRELAEKVINRDEFFGAPHLEARRAAIPRGAGPSERLWGDLKEAITGSW